MSLAIVIIGAGLGGLAAALSIRQESPHHDVLIVESAPVLAEIGAGLQLTPNATRLLVRWGLEPSLGDMASSPQEFLVRRYDGQKLLGERQNFAAEMLEKYGSYYWDMHRADLQLAMYERAKGLGVRFQFGTLVTDVDPTIPELTTDKGEKITGDLIIAADGLWSKTRSAVLGRPSPPIATGDLAYRIVLKSEDIKDQELLEFTKKPRVCLWAGPNCHAIYYPLRNNTIANVVLLVPDNLPDDVAKQAGDVSVMKGIFEEWDPLLQKFLGQVKKVEMWKLMHLDELEMWYNEDGTVVFLGDACHPMLPYMAQGAGSALEDGAALGIILSKVQSQEELPKALKTYQDLRAPRSTALQKWSMKQLLKTSSMVTTW
ncbi:related to 2-polyprenyl-6-methoxyphenol hydroxylase and related FAD-dependent oxidoreductases [Cephalotrichum gorgonifer]|uniref:Related to 2-polyprenyl-6-methoxyphenol hydroxylase and related FAD-dependent oxidoreductases n=1 Tax=Cephalotrichum gorgonifer TaxID=2041049 RepID=A0AAE8SQE0_9PEZI|nr:related to 2-polyprenyl-6-methoxyphenol hydroxylase and related FAD-dependent oxidoreductases [Cephalotrichum gorgonifer]